MKKFLMLLFTLIFISFSCRKSGTISITNNDVAGTWLLKEYSGGIAFQVIIPTYLTSITFERSGKYSLSTNFAITSKGNFRIMKAQDANYYSPTVINLSADGGNQITYGVTLKSDSLFLSESCCDGYSYTYIKRK